MYSELSQRYKALYGENTVVLIEVGSFYELYNCDKNLGADVRRVCELLNVQATRKNKGVPDVSRSNPMLAGIPVASLPKYLPVLLEADMTVVLANQMPNTGPQGGQGVIERRVTRVISRTTHLPSGPNSSGRDENNLVAIFLGTLDSFGWAAVDLGTGRTSAGHAADAAELFHVLEVAAPAEVAIFGPLSAKVPDLGLPGAVVRDMRSPKSEMSVAYQDAVLRKVFTPEAMGFLTPAEFVDLERCPAGLAAFVAALQFAYDHDETVVGRLQRPAVPRAAGLRLGYNALRQVTPQSPP